MPRKALSQDVQTSRVSQAIDDTMEIFKAQRKTFERKWYDNNFFDDGYHFRYVSRQTGKIIDLSEKQSYNIPQRAIPKASRQIRGVANLLLGPEYRFTIYPEDVTKAKFPQPEMYKAEVERVKSEAQKTGNWMSTEWDDQSLKEKMIHMVILAAKHSISFLQIWGDYVTNDIRSQVYDAFDIYLMGSVDDIYKSPSIIKATPKQIKEIQANEIFDEAQLTKLNPDNKYASSEIKQAYMQARFGPGPSNEQATIIQKECFTKEYLNDDNWSLVKSLGEENGALEGKSKGDMVMRHTFTAGGVWLKDEYVDLEEYPFVDYRMEPGPVYQTPLIERFIPANKSLDIVSSRVEKYANTMVSGIWLKRKGENFQIANIPGGQVVEYNKTKPEQMQMASVPTFMFNYMQYLEGVIEEQGASTSAMGQIPSGVKSGTAIESLKQTEYANLKIPSDMLKDTIERVGKRMLEIGSKWMELKPVEFMDQGEPDYFKVLGERGIDKRKELGFPIPEDVVPLKKGTNVKVEVESGMGYTTEGKRNTMQQIVTFMTQMAQQGLLSQDAVKVLMQKFLDTFGFGATQDFMEAMDSGLQSNQMSEDQLTQMKIAVAEVLKDLNIVGPKKDEEDIMKTKVGVVEAMQDMAGSEGQQPEESEKPPSRSISFKDLPASGKAQLAAQAGIQIDPGEIQMEEAQNAINKQPAK